MQIEKLVSDNKFAPSSVVIDRVVPEIDGGRFAVKRYLDQEVLVTAHLLVHGHDLPKGRLGVRHESEKEFTPYILTTKWNDEWTASFTPGKLGRYFCTVEASMDRFGTWKQDIQKKSNANQDLQLDLQSGQLLLKQVLPMIKDQETARSVNQFLSTLNDWIQTGKNPEAAVLKKMLDDSALTQGLHGIFEKESYVQYSREIIFQIEPVLARFSSWYEFFPRSTTAGPLHHGTLKEAETRLPYIKNLGFNIVYLPPIHPIGKSFRKGKNNSLEPLPGDVGSPWAIGAESGGHKDILPELGTFADFESFVKKARALELEVALDIAFQCSPDHPYVKSHPEWFKKRPDGSIQYAENPPKKYQDIYPFDFECAEWKSLWTELLSVVEFWIGKGVKVFRVDNPHTKPFHFWEWLIAQVRKDSPEVIFLAEAFTRPKIMAYLAKSGFSQSYTYFTWRNTKWELTQYLTELTQTELKDYFVPNFWPNTPDILHEHLQEHNPGIYKQRLVLAATMSSNYGIYGPTFELMEYKPREKNSEEYLDSEKYQLRSWDLNDTQSLAPYLKKINTIRAENVSLQQNQNTQLLSIDNESLISYAKSAGDERIVIVVNLDAHKVQSGLLELPLTDWEILETEYFEMEDLLTGAVYTWSGWRNYIELRPQDPAHIFKLKTKPRPATLQGVSV
jgi:starch synthase (maltosyl-transferring)